MVYSAQAHGMAHSVVDGNDRLGKYLAILIIGSLFWRKWKIGGFWSACSH